MLTYQEKGVSGLAWSDHADLTVCYTWPVVSNLSFFPFSFTRVSYFLASPGKFHQKPRSSWEDTNIASPLLKSRGAFWGTWVA